MVGVLHTWTRALIYHPHVHYIVTGGGLSEQATWKPSREDFLVPVKALSLIFRAKLRDQLQKAGLLDQVDQKVWNKDWVVHSEPVGTGEAAFKYLAPSIFRVAIGNHRILKLDNGTVTFEYKKSATDRVRTCEVTAEEFIRRFLQHVLPDRFIKVRYYGLLSPSNRMVLDRVRLLLGSPQAHTTPSDAPSEARLPEPLLCPKCKSALRWLAVLSPAAWNRKPP